LADARASAAARDGQLEALRLEVARHRADPERAALLHRARAQEVLTAQLGAQLEGLAAELAKLKAAAIAPEALAAAAAARAAAEARAGDAETAKARLAEEVAAMRRELQHLQKEAEAEASAQVGVRPRGS
jgi:hypothetical protein